LRNAFDLTGQRAVVTGGNRGLGAGIALELARHGVDVISVHRAEAEPAVVGAIRELGREYTAVRADVGDVDRIPELVERVLATGRVDILVNNAVAQRRHPATDFPVEDWDFVLDVNLKAVFLLCQGFARPMLQRGRGKIINLASLLSFQGGFTLPAYAASKGGVPQLTKALANEWAARGVNVNAVAPGYMDTEMNEALKADPVRSAQISARIPAGRWGRPDDVGGAVVFLASPAADYVHGHVLVVDGGWLAR
jgi:2-deoxy-D-gluconate 3-dehydrogenase